ncbi:hypothetical protein JL722_4884 [Aureococcus anophagefferens]|nr:hypothetical protein JL722_4884 [Aureococcus anophagefferens]
MLQPIVALALVAAPALAQYPGHGVAKTTYACYEPFKAASWLLKYLPVASTEDSCAAGTCASGIYQGRVQLVVTGYLRERKCDLLNLDAYADAFAKDGVPTLKASWTTAGGDTYSLFVAVPHSVLVVELISDELTGGDDGATLETRMSDRNAARLKTEAKATPNNLYEVNVNRATTNLTAVTAFYEDALNCTVTLDATAHGAHRRCFIDVCRRRRARAAFSVRDFEDNFWAVHEANIDGPNHGDKYNDFHYAMDGDGLQPAKVSGDYLVDYFTKHTPTLTDRYWYAGNTKYNEYNKGALDAVGGKTAGMTMTVSTMQLGVCAAYAIVLWVLSFNPIKLCGLQTPDRQKLPGTKFTDILKTIPVGFCAATARQRRVIRAS